MLLSPKNTKFKYKFVPNSTSIKYGQLCFGELGLCCLEGSFITNKHLESIRGAINKHLKRRGFIWIKTFPHYPFTKKPSIRMGRGKGGVEGWYSYIPAGSVFIEIHSISTEISLSSLKSASQKVPFYSKIIYRNGV